MRVRLSRPSSVSSYEERFRIINSIIRTHKKETTYEEFLAKSFTPLATKTLGTYSASVCSWTSYENALFQFVVIR